MYKDEVEDGSSLEASNTTLKHSGTVKRLTPSSSVEQRHGEWVVSMTFDPHKVALSLCDDVAQCKAPYATVS